MTIDPTIAYHLRELEVARNPDSPDYAMPDWRPSDRTVLDIGCGIGQTYAARTDHDRLLVGVDVSLTSLAYGRSQFDHIAFVNGVAERLPFRDGLFDLVISRVSLPYTDIPTALVEVERVLKSDGRVWFTLHSFSMVWRQLVSSLRSFAIRDVVYRIYVILNGVAFHLVGKRFPFLWKKRYESCQSVSGMKKAMGKAGFTEIWVGRQQQHLVCTARRGR